MKTKMKTIILGLVIVSFPAMALLTGSFPGWDSLTQRSPDIIIAQCTKTPDPSNMKAINGITIDMEGGLIYSDIEVVSILKGATNWGSEPLKAPSLGAARMSSQYWPRQGEYYLIFSIYYGEYQANEGYRVIPLGTNFPTNSLNSKKLDEQIQMLLQHRLDNLNHQMKDEQEEKQRLEKGVKK